MAGKSAQFMRRLLGITGQNNELEKISQIVVGGNCHPTERKRIFRSNFVRLFFGNELQVAKGGNIFKLCEL